VKTKDFITETEALDLPGDFLMRLREIDKWPQKISQSCGDGNSGLYRYMPWLPSSLSSCTCPLSSYHLHVARGSRCRAVLFGVTV
jgi:hypothetical protein